MMIERLVDLIRTFEASNESPSRDGVLHTQYFHYECAASPVYSSSPIPSSMPRRHRITSATDRERIMEAYRAEQDFLVVAAALGVQRTTAYSIVRVYQRENRVEAAHAGGRHKIIDNETLDLIVMLLEANPMMTLREIKEEVMDIFPTKPHFRGADITENVPWDSPAEGNSPAVKEARHAYATWMLATGLQQQLVYIDETGFNLWTKRTYGRARRGERLHRAVGGQRGRNTTVIAAIAEHCGILSRNSLWFSDEGTIIGDARSILVLDNAPIHNGIPAVYPELNFKFLPPYSPCLNPIENCFSVFKSYLKQYLHREAPRCNAAHARQEGVTLNALRENILQVGVEFALPSVTEHVVSQNYNHVNTYLFQCIERRDIFN
ncbi:putative DDE superfamily endonuclease domain-containing protein 21 [Homarus americanus]|uniref:Putative DDE superfamily endonuclease domain-containing protein 21 n=1 Tax=Homarus americanus TaxID=6706 RepID=A0A8J5JYE6_HOMAM|nr:putative DDE superfamily endonuclease domain-containing protein 21 [Homarus americanus]